MKQETELLIGYRARDQTRCEGEGETGTTTPQRVEQQQIRKHERKIKRQRDDRLM
jgi:hypothetical protein